MARLVFAEVADKPYDAKKYKIKRKNSWRQVSLLLQPSNKKWWEDPDVTVAFNLPRISARLERLMGTNVVKLTDRNYMKQLRESIDSDYRKRLQQRIKTRERKEIERERVLIIEGKTDDIPFELVDDPIFTVNREANVEIQKERTKLKTSREKNAEHLRQQGIKWERERLQHATKEAEVNQKKNERVHQQKMLVEQYRQEDAERGMDLLRIESDDWRECELDLKAFLESERTKMKERSMRVPTPYTSDPLDMQNILRAKQRQRQLEKNKKDLSARGTAPADAQKSVLDTEAAGIKMPLHENREQSKTFETESFQERMRRRYLDDATDVSEESVITENISSISAAKERYAAELEEEMENEVRRGLLISRMQYDQLRYENEKILALRNARDIRELYQLAEEIIMGETIEEEVFDLETEEEGGEEEQQLEISE